MKTQHIVIRRVLTALVCFASALFASLSPMEDAAAEGFGYYRDTWIVHSGYATQADAIDAAAVRCVNSGGTDCNVTTENKASLSDDNLSASAFSAGQVFYGSRFISPLATDPTGTRRVVIGIGGDEALAMADAIANCNLGFTGSLTQMQCSDGIMSNRGQVCTHGGGSSDSPQCVFIVVDPPCPGDQTRAAPGNPCMLLNCPPDSNGNPLVIDDPMTRTMCVLQCTDGKSDIGGDECALVCNAKGQTENGNRTACICRTDEPFVGSGAGTTTDPLVCTLMCPGAEEPNSAGTECRCDSDSGNVRPTEGPNAGMCVVAVDCSVVPDFVLDRATNMCVMDCGEGRVAVDNLCEVKADCSNRDFVANDRNICVLSCTAPREENDARNGCKDPPTISTGGNNIVPGKQAEPANAYYALWGGLAVFYLLNYYGGSFADLSFSPDYEYAATENGYSYRYGGRADFHEDGWRLYWTATQSNANGKTDDLRYGSGGSYSTDLWTATFSERVSGKTADYDFSLSADVDGGIWKLSPIYRIHSRFSPDKSETDSALNLEAVLRWNRWTISPSAGFRWENANNFGDNARFGLRVVREF